MQALLYICTSKKATCFWPRYYPKPPGYVHLAECCIGCYQGSIILYRVPIKALSRPYQGAIKAVLRSYYGCITALFSRYYTYMRIYIRVCVCVCVMKLLMRGI